MAEKFLEINGQNLFQKSWSIHNPKANILFLHGLAEHCSRYEKEALYFNQQGYNFFAYDQRTHGKSSGKRRSYIRNIEDYILDYEQVLEVLSKENEKPFFLLAHSFGGMILISYLLNNSDLSKNIKGVCFSAPFFKANEDMAPILQKLSGVVAKIMPNLKTVKIDTSMISNDLKEIHKYREDPLIYHDGLYACTGYEMLRQCKYLEKHFQNFNYPFIIQHGSNDGLAEINGAELLYRLSPSKDKTFIKQEGFKHEILKDIGHQKVLDTFSDWMNAHI